MAVATGIFLAGGAVAAIVIAERHMRARQRRSYRPGSGRRDALPTPPAVRGMTRAHHTNPYRNHLDPFQHDTTAHSTARTSTHTPRDTNVAATRQLPRPVLPAGMRNNQPVHIELGHGPIALVGPGAGDVARALIATTLSGVTDTTGPGQVIMSMTEADELLGPDHTTRALPTGITITTDLNASLAAARRRSTDISRPRAVASEQPAARLLNTGPVVLITNAMRPQQRADIHARVTELNATGVGVLVLGEHPEANTCEVNSEHIATAVHGPAVAHLDGTHLFNLAIDHIGDTFSPFTPHTQPTTSTHPGGDPTDAGESEPIHDAGHSDIHGDGPRSGLDAEDEYEQDLPGGTRPSETDPPDPTTRTTEHNPGRVAALLPAAWDGGLIRKIGTRDGEPLHYDLGAFAGLGLTGPGASAALRALWIQLITPTPTPAGLDPTPAAAQVIIPIDAADALLGAPELETATDPSHATIEPATDEQEVLLLGWPGEVESLDAALDQLEVEIMTRTRGRLDPTTDPTSPTPAWAPIVLITRSPDDLERRDTHEDHAGRDAIEGPDTVVDAAASPAAPVDRQAADWVARLRDVGERGAAAGIAVIVLGHWAYGTTCHVDETGQVSAPRGAGGFALRDATLAQLDTTSARAFFDNGYTTPPENPADPMPNVPDTADADPDAAEDHSNGDPVTEPQRGGTASALDHEHANQDGRTANDGAPGEHDHGREGVGAEPLEVSANTEERESSARTSPVTEPIPASAPRPTLTPDLAGVPADALLVLLVLGPLAVFARSAPSTPLREITGKLSPTQRLILAALAARTEPLHTEVLLDMCFPNVGGSGPVHRLHSHLTRLRGVLRTAAGHDPDIRLIRHTAERYHFSDACWIDNHILHAQLRANTTAKSAEQTAARAAAAFALYRGPLLAGLEYDTDTHWLDPQREHTLRTMIDLARQLADHHANSHPGQAANYLAAALRLDPHNDDTARHLITHHLAHGHRNAARHTLAQLTWNLAEIGEIPRPETLALLEGTPSHGSRQWPGGGR